MGTDPAALRKEFNDLARSEWITWRADSNHNGRPDLSEVVPEEWWKEGWNRLTTTERSADIDRLFGRASLIVASGRELNNGLLLAADALEVLAMGPRFVENQFMTKDEMNSAYYRNIILWIRDISNKPDPRIPKALVGYLFLDGALVLQPDDYSTRIDYDRMPYAVLDLHAKIAGVLEGGSVEKVKANAFLASKVNAFLAYAEAIPGGWDGRLEPPPTPAEPQPPPENPAPPSGSGKNRPARPSGGCSGCSCDPRVVP